VDVHVAVRVDMVQRQAGRMECLKLRPDLPRQLAPDLRQNKKTRAGASHIPVKPAAAIDQAGDLGRRQRRNTVDENEMQADAQVWEPAGARHRVGRRRGGYHQAGGGKDALAVRLLNRLIDRRIEPEIIRADDQRLQLAISRLRRN
jgi:hypothetical protein